MTDIEYREEVLESYYDEVSIQNPHDPIEESDAELEGMKGEVYDPYDEAPDPEPLRLNNGILDFLQTIVDGARALLSDIGTENIPQRAQRNDPICVREVAAPKWRGRTGVVNAPTLVLSHSKYRVRVRIWNLSDDDLLIGSQSFMPGNVGTSQYPPNAFVLPGVRYISTDPVYYPSVVIETTDDIWMCGTSGSDQRYTLIEEFDL